MRKLITWLAVAVIVLPPAVFAVWAWATLSYSYSKGERSGYVQKFSQKGWVCKTWEGDLAMVNLPGAMPEIFHFSVRDENTVKEIQSRVGQRVSLAYDEHRFVPTNCFAETPYFATGVRTIDAAPMGAPSKPAAAPAAPPAASPL